MIIRLLSILCLPLYLCITGCNQVQNSDGPIIIDVNIRNEETPLDIKISEVAPLETNDKCLIGYTSKVVWLKDHIYILDDYRSKALFIFDKKGRNVYRSVTGKGPDEISAPAALNIDWKENNVQLLDETKKVIYSLDSNGRIVDTRCYPSNVYVIDFYPLEKGVDLVYYSGKVHQTGMEDKKSTYILYQNHFDQKSYLNHWIGSNKFANAMLSPVDYSTSQVLFVAPWDYSIYELDGNSSFPRYIVDFGPDGLSQHQLEDLSSYELLPLIHSNVVSKVGCLQSVFQNGKHLLIFAEYDDYGLNILYSKENKTSINLNSYIKNGHLPQLKVWGFRESGDIYAIVSADSFISFQNESGRFADIEVGKNDNPVMISLAVKDFKK